MRSAAFDMDTDWSERDAKTQLPAGQPATGTMPGERLEPVLEQRIMRDEWIVCERGYPAESCAATADVQAVASGTGILGVGTARECASQPSEAAAGEIANTNETVQDAPNHYVREARLKPSPVRH
jgi:hypothetical protein